MDQLDALRRVDFNWAVHPDLVWNDDIPDVREFHGQLCEELLETALELRSPAPCLGRVILGTAGAGKTHIIAKLRRLAIQKNVNFVMADLTDVSRFFDTLLLGFLVSLQRVDATDQPQMRAILASVIQELNPNEDALRYARNMARCNAHQLENPINVILDQLRRKYPEKFAQVRDTARALFLLNSEHYEICSIGQTWLQGSEIEADQKSLFHFASASQRASDIVHALSWLASLRGPTIVAIDQLDPIVAYNRLAARAESMREPEESALTAKAILSDISNGLGGLHAKCVRTLPVVACLETSWKTLDEFGLKSNLQRFDSPLSLPMLPDGETAKAIVRCRLEAAYASTAFAPPYPTWPFADSFFSEARDRLPRTLLKRCDEHRKQCVRNGEATELRHFEALDLHSQPSPPQESLSSLDQRFEALQGNAKISELLDESLEDEHFAPLLVTAANCLITEAPPVDDQDVVIDTEITSRFKFVPLHARIRVINPDTGAEKHYCIRALQKTHHAAYKARLNAAITSAGIDTTLKFRNLVIFRTTAPPTGQVTSQRTQAFKDRGGIMVHPEEYEIATLWALQQLAAEGHNEFDEWLRQRQPVHNLPMIQAARLAKPPTGPTEAPPLDRPQLPTPPAPTRPPSAATEEKSYSPVTAPPPATRLQQSDGKLPVGVRLIGAETRGDALSLPLMELRKHTVIFAGSGSGKTVLLKRIIEEAALLGVPSIAIDTANDLAQLGDAWPAAPQSWGGEDPVKAEQYFNATETVIWTPGLEGGNPLRLEPLPDLAAVVGDVDELNAALAMAREALADVVAPGTSESAKTRLGILTAALRFMAGQRGSGLHMLIDLLSDLPPDADGGISGAQKQAQKMADALRSQMQMDPLLGGTGESLDPAVLFGLKGGNKTRISVINFAGLGQREQQQQFLNRLAMTLFAWIKNNPADKDTPLRGILVVDEARDFIPSAVKSPCRDSFVRLAAQARKYGLGLVFATQAPKSIYTEIVANCATSFYGSGRSPAVIDAIKELLQNQGGRGDDIARLGTGRFYFHNADVTKAPVKITTAMSLSHHRDPLPPDTVVQLAKDSKNRLA